MDNVINLHKEGHIAFVALEEKEYKNTFTMRFVYGLKEAFKQIDHDDDIKVVIVHGYDPYFCCGGTKDELISLYEGINQDGEAKIKFTDMKFHDILLQCKVPVISAMQGHALGGGLALGCYADVIVMGEQYIYNTNFMKYGFTPGMGATYIIPKKFGDLLGNEMLFSAKNYYGAELKERGAAAKIVKKEEVIRTAVEIARDIADKPILSLKELKKNLCSSIMNELPAAIERELDMHYITFRQPEVLRRIENLF